MKGKKTGSLGGVNRVKEYWRNRMSSKNRKMSRGASHVDKIISWARGENWRRKNKKK